MSPVCLDLKHPYAAKLQWKPHPVGYVTPQFSKFNYGRGCTREYVVSFLDSIRAHAQNVDVCIREFSKPSTDWPYTWYVNLKPGSMHDQEHLVSLFNTKFFCTEAKFVVAEIGQMHQFLGVALDAYVMGFMTRPRISKIRWPRMY